MQPSTFEGTSPTQPIDNPPIHLAKEDYLAVQVVNGKMRNLQLEFQLLASESARLAQTRDKLMDTRRDIEREQAELTLDLSARYGVDFTKCEVDPLTLQIRPARPQQGG